MKKSLLAAIFSKDVTLRSLKVTLVVGSILALINHGYAIREASLSVTNIYQILLSYLTPYCVSTYSSVQALRQAKQQHSTDDS